MKHVQVDTARGFFRVVAQTSRSQAASMVLQPGKSTGGEDNVHPDADQWLYVISGRGTATVAGRRVYVVRNDGRAPLVTVNVYAPSGIDGADA